MENKNPSFLPSLDRLGTQIATTMMRAAVTYVQKQGVKLTDPQIDRLCAVLKGKASSVTDQILADGRTLIDSGRSGWLDMLIQTAAQVAGLEAAKEILGENK